MFLLTNPLLVLAGYGAAYLDPGSGSILIQILIGAAAAAGLVIGSLWSRIKGIFGKKEAENEDLSDE
ncbi:MAG: hypothetical protein JXA13_17015 [Anaerolineales bacterium]|nr:hypothetical protein [Anaerolineales bacterium]